MLRSLLVALMILCAGNLLYAHTYSAAFEEASRGYALVTTEEYSQFETSDLGKNARDIFILARTYGSRILDIQLSMPTIADSLLGDRQGAPRSDTFKLIFTENLGALDDFASGSRVLRSGRAARQFSLARGECIISSTLAERNNIQVGDTLTLIHYFTWSFRFNLTVADIYEDRTYPYLGELGSYTGRRNEIIAHMDTLLSNPRVVPILQSRQIHCQYLIERNDLPLSGDARGAVVPLALQYGYIGSNLLRASSLSLRLLLIFGAALACAEISHRLYKRRRERERERLMALYRLPPPKSRSVHRALFALCTISAALALYPLLVPRLEALLLSGNGGYTVTSSGNALPSFLEPFYEYQAFCPTVNPAAALLALPYLSYLLLSDRLRVQNGEALFPTDGFAEQNAVLYCTSREEVLRMLHHNDAFTLAQNIQLTVGEYCALFGLPHRGKQPMESLPYEERTALQLEVAARFQKSRVLVWNDSHSFEDHPDLWEKYPFRYIVLTLDIMPQCSWAVYGCRENKLLLIREQDEE